MEPIKKILQGLHKWPEEARRTLAIILFLVAAIGVFFGWSRWMSSRLIPLTSFAPQPTLLNRLSQIKFAEPEIEKEIPGPFAGIVGSINVFVERLKSSLESAVMKLEKYIR